MIFFLTFSSITTILDKVGPGMFLALGTFDMSSLVNTTLKKPLCHVCTVCDSEAQAVIEWAHRGPTFPTFLYMGVGLPCQFNKKPVFLKITLAVSYEPLDLFSASLYSSVISLDLSPNSFLFLTSLRIFFGHPLRFLMFPEDFSS